LPRVAHPATREEILAQLASNSDAVAAFYREQPEPLLFTGDPDRWGPAHHLVHLTMTGRAIARGLGAELPLHRTGRSRSYGEMIAAATAALQSTPPEQMLERGRVVVVPAGASRAGLVDEFVTTSAGLRAAAGAWQDAELDRRALTHPLIGVLTAREMLLFCVFHERHHLKQVRARLEAGGG